MNFLDNHDVERIASILADKAHLRPAWGLLFGMPGVPAVYYGSEWGAQGRKADGDAALRPACAAPQETGLTQYIAALARAPKARRCAAAATAKWCRRTASLFSSARAPKAACWWP